MAALCAVTGWYASCREGIRAFWGGEFGPVEYNHKPGVSNCVSPIVNVDLAEVDPEA